jgi:hypothetical protein
MYVDPTHKATRRKEYVQSTVELEVLQFINDFQTIKTVKLILCYEVCWSQGTVLFLSNLYIKFDFLQDGHYNETAEPEFAVLGGSASASCPSSVH